MKYNKKLAAVMMSAVVLISSAACTASVTDTGPEITSRQISSDETSDSAENNRPESDKLLSLPEETDLHLSQNRTPHGIFSCDENKRLLVLVREYSENFAYGKDQRYINCLYEYDNTGKKPAFVRKIPMPALNDGQTLTDCTASGNGTFLLYTVNESGEDDVYRPPYSCIADITEDGVSEPVKLSTQNITGNTDFLKKKLGTDQIVDDNVSFTGRFIGEADEKFYLLLSFAADITETDDESSRVRCFAVMDPESKKITLYDIDEKKLYPDQKTSVLDKNTFVLSENSGKYQLLSIRPDSDGFLWGDLIEYNPKTSAVKLTQNEYIHGRILPENCSDYRFNGFLTVNISCSGKLFYYTVADETTSPVSFCISAETLTKHDPSQKKPPAVDGSAYDKYDTSDFKSVQRKKTGTEKHAGVYYELFVRSFADSDGDGTGDLKGVISKLDYLQELGIDGIWLMPVFASSSYYGYDVTDLYSVNPEYGTEDDLKKLISEAHKRDIKIILDLVTNHTSAENNWFQQAKSDPKSKFKNYYRWTVKSDKKDFSNQKNVSGGNAWNPFGNEYYFAVFGASMPDLNYNNSEVRKEIKNAAKKYLEMGADGFRIDSANRIYSDGEFRQMKDKTAANVQWWNEFATFCESIKPDVYIAGDVREGNSLSEEYIQPFDSKFDYALQSQLLNSIKNNTALNTDGYGLSYYIENLQYLYSEQDSSYLNAIFASNHDQDRIASRLDSDEQAMMYACVYLTLPGNPFIYYGEELGMYGSGGSLNRRTPFLWGDKYTATWTKSTENASTNYLRSQLTDERSFYTLYKELIALRKENPALSMGSFGSMYVGESVLAYSRSYNGNSFYVFHNLSSEEATVDLDPTSNTVIFSNGDVETDNKVIKLSPYATLIIR